MKSTETQRTDYSSFLHRILQSKKSTFEISTANLRTEISRTFAATNLTVNFRDHTIFADSTSFNNAGSNCALRKLALSRR